MEVAKQQLEKVRPLHGQVLVELELYNDQVKFEDGTSLELDVSYNPENHVRVDGIVKAFSPDVKIDKARKHSSYEWLPEIDINVGDHVYFSYFTVLMALGRKANEAADFTNERYLECDGKLYIFVHYTELFFQKN